MDKDQFRVRELLFLAGQEIDQLKAKLADLRAENERLEKINSAAKPHGLMLTADLAKLLTDKDNEIERLRGEVERLEKALDEIEPCAAKWWQVYQDQCEGAYIEASIAKELRQDIKALKESAEIWKQEAIQFRAERDQLKAQLAEAEKRAQRAPEKYETVCHNCGGSGWAERGY